MPSFGRLSKHSNRSQHALPEQLLTGASPGAPGTAQAQHAAGGAGAAAGAANTASAVGSTDSPLEALPTSALSALSSATTPHSPSDLLGPIADARLQQQQQQLHQQQQQQLQHHHHQQQSQQQSSSSSSSPPPPPLPPLLSPHLLNAQTAGAASPSPITPSPFDGHQSLTPTDFAPGVGRSQSRRYGAPLVLTPQHQHLQPQQQQQVYGIGSGSIDDLPSIGGAFQSQQQQQPLPPPPPPPHQQSKPLPQHPAATAPASQKRSTRKLIKGIFGSSRETHEISSPQQPIAPTSSGPYDNTAGLARRPSKRVSKPPNLKTSSFQAAHAPTSRDWQALSPSSSQQQPPLREVVEVDELDELDEYSIHAHASNLISPAQDSRVLLSNDGTRHISRDNLETTLYDKDYQPPDHPPPQQQAQSSISPPIPLPAPPLDQAQSLQRRGTIRIPEPQHAHYESQQQNQQQFLYAHDLSQQQVGDPRTVTSQQLASSQNAETVSQLSYDSSVTDSDPRSALSQHQLQQASQGIHRGSTPSLDISAHHPEPSQGASLEGQDSTDMTPSSSRRAQDAEKGLRGQGEAPSGSAPGYARQGSLSVHPMSPLPNSGQDPGRNSPQPSDGPPDFEKQHKDLQAKYKHVKQLYWKGKSQNEQLQGQVEQLQNAVANQRMSQSRTAWDDNEYSTRFNRLNGAINNLAFNIRKDWRALPPWLAPLVSADALKIGKQEMTAVGRAFVSRWLVGSLFDRCFHPGLDAQFSSQLKDVELSIRGNTHTMHSQEEFTALTTKVVNWRMTTLDGLQQRLGSVEAAENRAVLTQKATSKLTEDLHQFLKNPPPPGVEGSASMIVELAVAIAANLPLESRDVAITYPLPGEVVQASIMEVEKTGLPPLERQKDAGAASDSGADDDDDDDDDKGSDGGGKSRGDGGRLGRAKDLGKVRFAGFVALEVRGRQVLAKAPVWTL